VRNSDGINVLRGHRREIVEFNSVSPGANAP
jgi:hypothetical protein